MMHRQGKVVAHPRIIAGYKATINGKNRSYFDEILIAQDEDKKEDCEFVDCYSRCMWTIFKQAIRVGIIETLWRPAEHHQPRTANGKKGNVKGVNDHTLQKMLMEEVDPVLTQTQKHPAIWDAEYYIRNAINSEGKPRESERCKRNIDKDKIKNFEL